MDKTIPATLSELKPALLQIEKLSSRKILSGRSWCEHLCGVGQKESGQREAIIEEGRDSAA
jgi:hypothetical protein